MAESCKYCESELSPMDGVYIQSELHTSPQKVQNLIEHNQNMVCYNCFKRLKSMRIVDHEKDLKNLKMFNRFAEFELLNFTGGSFW